MPGADRSVPYVNLPAQFADEREEILAAVTGVLERGDFIGGAAVDELETALARYHGVSDAVCLNSGTDALILSLRVLGIGPGDEVITPTNSFVASTACVVAVGARPVLVDVLPDQNVDPEAVRRAVTSRTKAIMPVHLTGRIADMDALGAIARDHGLAIIEDAAQAIGSRYHDRLAGTLGDIGCFSAHPLKNLNACGDAGFMLTDRPELAARARLLRNHGLADRNTVTEWGAVARLDTLKAAVLLVRLRKLDAVIERRRKNAALYRQHLADVPVFIPPDRNHEFNTFHTFVVQGDRRDDLQQWLKDRGIGSAIHYPIPIHLQPAAKDLGYKLGDFPVAEEQAGRILTLPVNQFLTDDEVARVADAVGEFYGARPAR